MKQFTLAANSFPNLAFYTQSLSRTTDNGSVFPTMMNRTAIYCWIVSAACLLLNGCTVCQLAMRTVRYEPAAYSLKHDKQRSFRLYRAWAEDAWQQELQGCIGETPSTDYGLGFRDGFVDYVYLGGTGEPPPVPPRRFWNAALRSPEGHAGAQQWFDGYRRGAQAARNGGYRQMATLRSSLMGVDAQRSGEGAEMYAPVESDYQERGPFEDDLPLPDSAIQPETKGSPEQSPTEPLPSHDEPVDKLPASGEPAKVDASTIEKLQDELPTKESTSVPAASEDLPQDLNLPSSGSREAPPVLPQEPSGRKVAPPLEEITPPAQTVPDTEPLKSEKQESSSSSGGSEPAVAAAIEPSTPRLVLVQHVQPEPIAQGPAKSSATDLRFVNQENLSLSTANEIARTILPAMPSDRESVDLPIAKPATGPEIRFVIGARNEPVAMKPPASNGGLSTNSIRVVPTKEINAPAVRKIEQTSSGFTR